MKEGEAYFCFLQAPSEHLAAGYHRQRIGLNHLASKGVSRAHVDDMAAWVKASGYITLHESRYPFASGPGYYVL